jgi:hypothetical protein
LDAKNASGILLDAGTSSGLSLDAGTNGGVSSDARNAASHWTPGLVVASHWTAVASSALCAQSAAAAVVAMARSTQVRKYWGGDLRG